MRLLLVDNNLSLGRPLRGLNPARLLRALGRGVLWALAVTFSGVLLAGGTYLYIQRDGNFHQVESRLLYRSAQLDGQALRDLATSHGIKTVINLRGENTGKPWYDEEVNALRAAGIDHRDIRLSAYKDLTVQQMDDIIKVIDRAPKPILIHCESGADRTGLVAAIYRVSLGRDVAVAQQELSPKYGHFPYLLSRSGAMDRSLMVFAQSRGLSR